MDVSVRGTVVEFERDSIDHSTESHNGDRKRKLHRD